MNEHEKEDAVENVKNAKGWYALMIALSLILGTLTLKCHADTAPVTNTISIPATNEHMFYRLQAVPPMPQMATNEVSGGQTSPSIKSMSFVTSSMVTSSVPMVVPVDQIATLILTTNWSDFPPAGTAPVATTLQDTSRGLEYGTLVTNKVIQVLEDGVLHPTVVHSYTNTTEVLTRAYQFQRIHDPGSVRRHIKTVMGVR